MKVDGRELLLDRHFLLMVKLVVSMLVPVVQRYICGGICCAKNGLSM